MGGKRSTVATGEIKANSKFRLGLYACAVATIYNDIVVSLSQNVTV